MKKILFSLTVLLGLSACDWNTPKDYHPKAEFEKFVEDQEKAAEASKAQEAAKPADAAPAEAAPAAAAPAQ